MANKKFIEELQRLNRLTLDEFEKELGNPSIEQLDEADKKLEEIFEKFYKNKTN